jgi:hypothetical protein
MHDPMIIKQHKINSTRGIYIIYLGVTPALPFCPAAAAMGARHHQQALPWFRLEGGRGGQWRSLSPTLEPGLHADAIRRTRGAQSETVRCGTPLPLALAQVVAITAAMVPCPC